MFISELKILGTLFWLAYVAVAGGLIYAAVKKPASLRGKVTAAVAVVLAFSVLPGINAKEAIERKLAQAESAKYREAAWAHFRKRCKESAGERIYRSIENVEGIFLEKPRARPTETDLRDQYWMGDPYGHDSYGRLEVVAYLASLDENGIPVIHKSNRIGYKFVEVNTVGGRVVQYRREDPTKPPSEYRLDTRTARYAVTWSDISTPEDRRYWVAGGRLQVIDLLTNAVLGERIGYLFEAGFGSTSDGRRPWLFARLHYSERACPAFRRHALINREFVEKVIRPAKGEENDR